MSHANDVAAAAIDAFIGSGVVESILYQVKSGKEATVFCCRGGPACPEPLVAVKVYRDALSRAFKDDSKYMQGRITDRRETRVSRALAAKSTFGRTVRDALWTGHEFETLETLHAAGLDVPRPIAQAERGIAMSYFGDEDGAAPLLRSVRLTENEATPLLWRTLWNVERMLALNIVHGDLSPYNMLFWNDRVAIIDLPQAVDARFNGNAYDLLEHDIGEVCAYFARFGAQSDPGRIVGELWWRFINAEL